MIRGCVPIEIGGEDRTLKFDFNALAMLEERLNMPISKIFSEEYMGIRAIREALYVGLVHADRRLTPQRVGNMMEPDKFDYYAEKIVEALTGALGVDEEGEEEPKEES